MAESRLSTLVSLTLALCAVVMTGLVIRHEYAAAGSTPRPRSVSGWRALQSAGHAVGRAPAPVTIVEFSDYQCPACATFAPILRAAQAAHPDEVRLIYRHLPIPGHPHALTAAVAAECAATAGRFDSMHALLYARQRELGVRPWVSFASEAGVTDTAAFSRCLRDSAVVSRVMADQHTAIGLGINATPTIIVNDRMTSGAESALTLDRLIAEARIGVRD